MFVTPDSGLLLIDKPPAWTSHDMVKKLRGLLHVEKIGHTGTLDPAATGLLVLCINKATRHAEALCAQQKTYEATVLLGIATETGDADGAITEQIDVPVVSRSAIEAVLQRFHGEIEQRVPQYSAVKVSGKRLYKLARQGKVDIIPKRWVSIYAIELLDDPQNMSSLEQPVQAQAFRIRVTCSRGTYIRSLAEDLGRALGYPAHLSALRRIQVGQFHINDAWDVERLQAMRDSGTPIPLLAVNAAR